MTGYTHKISSNNILPNHSITVPCILMLWKCAPSDKLDSQAISGGLKRGKLWGSLKRSISRWRAPSSSYRRRENDLHVKSQNGQFLIDRTGAQAAGHFGSPSLASDLSERQVAWLLLSSCFGLPWLFSWEGPNLQHPACN